MTRQGPEAILRLAHSLEDRNPAIEEHCRRVAGYATAFGLHLNLSDSDLVLLERASILHDVGLARVPDSVLHKRGPLSHVEWRAIRRHPIVICEACKNDPVLAPLLPILRSHHERLDGSGYPDGLKGDEIPFLAQVLSIVDAYDALTSARPDRPACSDAQAINELRLEVQRGWRRGDLVESFAELLASTEEEVVRRRAFGEHEYATYVRDALIY